MNYELAKELKDAGFVVKDKPYGSFVGEHHFMPREEFFVHDNVQYDIPTLSELIEATGMDNVVNEIVERRMIELTTTSVARLWLALNKK